MELSCKPDFDKVMQRFEAWWHCQLIDRPLLTMGVAEKGTSSFSQQQRKPGSPLFRSHATLRDRWMDVEGAVDRFEAAIAGRQFLAEYVPVYYPNVGPEVVATLFGSELDFSENSSWSHPVAANCRDILSMKPNFDNPYWAAIRRGTAYSLQRGSGKWITGLADLHTNGDLLAALRDPENLCLDMIDDLEGARLACDYVTTFFPAIYEDCYDSIAAAGQPSTTWLPALHMGKSYTTSCDFICMISPAMFEATILPSLVEEMKYLERNIFHLDGPAALRHLDALLAIPQLNGIQWTYGAGNGPARRWIDVYKRVQAAGKNVFIALSDWQDLDAMIEGLRPEGVWLVGLEAESAEQHADVVRRLERWAANKP